MASRPPGEGPSERLADGNSILGELLIGPGRAEGMGRLTLMCYGNSRQRSHASRGFAELKARKEKRGQRAAVY